METSGAYSREEIDWVKNSITTPKPDTVSAPRERADKLKREWKDDPKTVPDGWKVAWTTTSDNRSKIAFMSPDKKIFHSRKAALQHMMQAGTYPPEDILKMTKGLNVLLNVGDEWKEGVYKNSVCLTFKFDFPPVTTKLAHDSIFSIYNFICLRNPVKFSPNSLSFRFYWELSKILFMFSTGCCDIAASENFSRAQLRSSRSRSCVVLHNITDYRSKMMCIFD